MTTIKWYIQGNDNYASIREWLDGAGEMFISAEAKEKLVQNLRNKFYEVAFDVQVNELNGDILKVTPTNL